MNKKYSFDDHPEHKTQLGAWAERWIKIALRTEPQTEADRAIVRDSMRQLYLAANLTPPTKVFCASPVSAAIATCIAAGVWWLRENPVRHQELFGRIVTSELHAAIPRAVEFAVRAAHGQIIPRTTRAATNTTTHAATNDATHAATNDATRAATHDATLAATNAIDAIVAIEAIDAIDAATNATTLAATYDATNATTYAATRAATYAATNATTRAATYAAIDVATNATTRAATYDAIDVATYDAIDVATNAIDVATYDAIDVATTQANGDIVGFLVQCCKHWTKFNNGGNQWAGWVSFISFFREVAKLGLPEYANWIYYENLAVHAGPRFMHAKFWIVSDFPTRICRDEQNRPHSASGPAIAWSDGWAQYYWHGVNVPREWIETPRTIDPSLVITHPNAEQRRCLAEIVGWDKVLVHLQANTVDTDVDPLVGELVEATIDERRERFLRVTCGTGRRFAIPVPPETPTAIAAQAWIHNLPETTIRALEVRT